MLSATEMLTALQRCCYGWRGVSLLGGEIDLAPGAKLKHIVWSAGLRTWPHIGRLPAAEGLSLDHGSRNRTVDIGVPHLDLVLPVRDLPVIQGVNATSEAEGDGVGQRDGFGDMLDPHETQHRAEAFGHMEERTGLHAELDARGPETVDCGIACFPCR